jgi:hypothetical protein
MAAPQLSRGIAGFGVALGLVVAATTGSPSAGAQKEPAKPAEPARFVGVVQCIGCHSFDNAEKNVGAKLYVAAGSTRFVRLNENITWSSHDLHSRAFQNIDPSLNATAKRMEQTLGKLRGASYKVTTDATCLACHATIKDAAEPLVKRSKDSFDTIQGVSCEMCHGHASNWLKPHADIKPGADGKLANAWRQWPAATKKDFGLVDLRDPAIRAEKCVSCHVGRAAEGRFVTHEMFAAGHPPLPPFDSTAYVRDQPRHWGIPREMPYLESLAKTRPDDAWKSFHYRDEKGEMGEVYAARHLAESTVATFRASVMHIGQLANEGRGLDFAAFDCYACHHDLKYPSPRQKRGFPGIPGRPTFRPALTAMVRIVVRNAAGEAATESFKELDSIEREMAMAFEVQTYGDPVKVRAAADKFEAWAGAALKLVQDVRYTRAKTLGLMKDIVAAGRDDAERVADPETAQLIAWALLTLREEFKETGTKEPSGMAAAITDLDSIVVLRLRAEPTAMKKARVPDPLIPEVMLDETPVPVEDRLKERMLLFNSFDPPKFRAAFKKLAPLVGEYK